MLLVMAVTLYTSRIVLARLGVEDFGIYNVVGGVVALLGFVSSSMSISVQRFMSYMMGKKDYSQVSHIFSMALQIHILIAVVLMILLEVFGLYLLEQKLVIPFERMDAALTVFHFSVLSCGISVIQVPFTALTIACERMGLYAYISIVEVVLKLLVAFLLGWSAYDSLSLYGGLMFVSSLIVLLAYMALSRFSFREVVYRRIWDFPMFKSLVGFASWTALGEMAWGFTLQGVNIVLNLFFGTLVNAAYGISSQVSSAVYRFIGSFQTALNPQLIKIYAQGDITAMLTLAYGGMKYSFFLLLLIAFPLLAEMDFVLSKWLGIVPSYAPIFCRLVVLNALLDTLSMLFATLAKAYGNIRNYQVLVSLTLFLNFPLSYLVLKAGAESYFVFVVYSSVSVSLILLRCRLIAKMFQVSVFFNYLKEVLVPVLKVFVISALPVCWVRLSMEVGWLRMWAVIISSFLSVLLVVYSIGLTSKERGIVNKKVSTILIRIFHGN